MARKPLLEETKQAEVNAILEYIRQNTKDTDEWLSISSRTIYNLFNFSQGHFLQLSEAIKEHPNIIYEIDETFPTRFKPYKFRWTNDSQEKFNQELTHKQFFWLTDEEIVYIKDTLQIDEFLGLSKILKICNILAGEKAKEYWVSIDVEDLAELSVLRVDQTEDKINLLVEKNLLVKSQYNDYYRLALDPEFLQDIIMQSQQETVAVKPKIERKKQKTAESKVDTATATSEASGRGQLKKRAKGREINLLQKSKPERKNQKNINLDTIETIELFPGNASQKNVEPTVQPVPGSNADVTDLKADVPDSNAGVTDLKADVPDSNAGVTDLKADVPGSDAGVTDLKTDAPDSNAGVTDLKADVPGSDAGVTDLKTDVPDSNAGVTDLKTDVPDSNAGVTDLKTDVPDSNAGVTDLKTDVPGSNADAFHTSDDILKHIIGNAQTIEQFMSNLTVEFRKYSSFLMQFQEQSKENRKSYEAFMKLLDEYEDFKLKHEQTEKKLHEYEVKVYKFEHEIKSLCRNHEEFLINAQARMDVLLGEISGLIDKFITIPTYKMDEVVAARLKKDVWQSTMKASDEIIKFKPESKFAPDLK